MRIHGVEWLGSLALVLTISASWAQNIPSAGVNAVDQAAPDTPSSIFPTFGLTLDGPVGFESVRDTEDSQPRPSDGLGLQIYDSPSPSPSGSNEIDHGAQGGHNP